MDLGQALERHGRDRATGLAETDPQRAIRLRRAFRRRVEVGPGGISSVPIAGPNGVHKFLHGADHRIGRVDPHRQDQRVLLELADRIHGREARCEMLVGLVQAAGRRGVECVDDAPRDRLGAPANLREACAGFGRAGELRRDRLQLSGIGRRGKSCGPRSQCGSSALERRDRVLQLGRGGRSSDEAVRGRDQRRRRIRFARNDLRRTGARRVQWRRQLALETIDRSEGVLCRRGDCRVRAERDLGAWAAAPKHDDQCDRSRGREEPPAYHGRMDLEVIRQLPKAELHQHLDGSVRPTTAVELAADIGMALTLEEASRRMVGPERCADQAELLTFFDLPIALLQTAPALERVAAELVEDLAADGIRYAEVRWAPRLHLERGLSVAAVIEAVATGVARASTHANAPLVTLIVTAMRSHPPAANAALARTAGGIGSPVVGFDLAGPEAAWPAPPHAVAFVAAREAGLALTAHAGEVSGAQRVREVLDFGVRRVAHGVTAIEDPALLDALRARDITLDLCPTSNVQAGIVPSLAEHPLAALHRAGVSVTVSTDDRTVTGITLSEELARSAYALDLSTSELSSIALNGFERAFASRSAITPLIAEATDAWHAWSRATIS